MPQPLMAEVKALEIVQGLLKDAKAWGTGCGLRVANHELVEALMALEARFGDIVTKEDLTYSNRLLTAERAQHGKTKADLQRIMTERDELKKKLK